MPTMRSSSSPAECDLLIVGGGINGTGIARDAAGRGLTVILCEQDDLASHTSSASSKLIHGGLRYLEYLEFGLVRKALRERELLLRSAPHIIRPLRFVMPHVKNGRPAWMIRAGLFLYDHLARRRLLSGSQSIDLRQHAAGTPLKSEFNRGFIYSDAWVDDARLVVLNAIDAREKGARILTRCRCESAAWNDGLWRIVLRDHNRDTNIVHARCLVNAAGPWAQHFLQTATHRHMPRSLRLVKGSHIVVKRLFDHADAYIFQHTDGRIVFALPYEHDFTLIGTTETDFRGDPGRLEIDPQEVGYLCDLANRYFRRSIGATDVLWSYSGVRPLVEDASSSASAVTRDYRLGLDTTHGPVLSVLGGKITTFRMLAEQAVDMLAPSLGNHQRAWTANACLPGGDIFGAVPSNRAVLEFDHYIDALQGQYPWLPRPLIARYARAYGSRIHVLLQNRSCVADMGTEIAAGLFAAEVDYWSAHEWAVNAEDMLWRRSKLGLHLPADTQDNLDSWLVTHRFDR